MPDPVDLCPRVRGPDENAGCPDTDLDNDGVVDRLDHCPDQAGRFEDGGCPVAGRPLAVGDTAQDNEMATDDLAELARYTGRIDGLAFAAGSSRLLTGSAKVLDDAAQVLRRHPRLHLVIIDYTDEGGSWRRDRELSHRRAVTVREALIRRKVEPSNLIAVGEGSENPEVSNATAAGQARNRRVVFNLLPATITAKANTGSTTGSRGH